MIVITNSGLLKSNNTLAACPQIAYSFPIEAVWRFGSSSGIFRLPSEDPNIAIAPPVIY